MFISGQSTYTPSNQFVGRLSDTKNTNSNLVYVYPTIFDSGLSKKWEMLIRDFQTAQFVNQIKTSNVLNILQIVTNRSVSSDSDDLAKLYQQSTSDGNATNVYHSMMMQQMARNERNNESRITSEEYIRRSHELQQYIKNQVINDPRYSNLRPSFSIISLENNMIDVPLIIGTKSYKVASSAMFWMVFVGLSQNSNGFANVQSIIRTVSSIPENQYLNILNNTYQPIDSTQDSSQKLYSLFRRETNESLEKAIRIFSRVAGSLSEFESDIGFGTNISDDSALFTSVTKSSISDLDSARTNMRAELNNEVVRIVFPLIQNINNMMVDPNITLDLTDRYQTLLNTINEIANRQFIETDASVSSRLSNTSELRAYLDIFKRNCDRFDNAPSILDEISNLRVLYRELLNSPNAISDIINRTETVNRTAQELNAHGQQMLRIFEDILRDNMIISNNAKRVNTLRNAFLSFYYDSNAQTNVYIPNSPPSETMQALFGQGITANEVDQFLNNNITAFTSIVNFLIIRSSIKGICEYLNTINAKIGIKSRDLTRFPNYTLVIPIEYARTLYYALASRNFRQTVENLEEADLNKFKINETEIFRILDAIITRLNVPNVVFIDDTNNTIYYKWSFLNRAFKLTRSTIESYLKSQESIIRAF